MSSMKQWLKNVRHKTWFDIILAVVSVTFGLAIQPIFQKAVDQEFSPESRAILISVLVLGFTVIGGIAAIGVYIKRSELNNEATTKTFEEIKEKIGLSARFVSDLPRGEAKGEFYRTATQIVSNAEKEILVLWYQNIASLKIPEGNIRNEQWRRERNLYHQTLIEKCHEKKNSKKFFYRRILQIKDFQKVKNGVIKKSMLSLATFEHCRKLLDFIHQSQETAVLKFSPIFIEQDFALIDERYILWEIDTLEPDSQHEHIEGLIIFDDVEGKFVHYLRDFFMKVDAHSVIVKQVVE